MKLNTVLQSTRAPFLGLTPLSGHLPLLALSVLLTTPLALFSLYGAIRHGEDIGRFPEYLSANVATALLVPFLLGLSIIFGN